jgi:hypothetical protein
LSVDLPGNSFRVARASENDAMHGALRYSTAHYWTHSRIMDDLREAVD